MSDLIQEIKVAQLPRNKFNLSYESRLTTEFGRLTPVLCEEVLPGDSFKITTNAFVRFMPLVYPIMNAVDCYIHYFYVPNRIMMPATEWQTFITGENPNYLNTTNELDSYVQPPYVSFSDLCHGESYDGLVGGQPTYGAFTNTNDFRDIPSNWNSNYNAYFACLDNSLTDYLNTAPTMVPGLAISGNLNYSPDYNPNICLFPYLAYQMIWSEYYRDENLQEPFNIGNISSGDQAGCEIYDVFKLRNRAYRKDYFTSCLPWQQKGPASLVPLGKLAPIGFYGVTSGAAGQNITFTSHYAENMVNSTVRGANAEVTKNPLGIVFTAGNCTITGNYFADLANASSATINDLRTAFKVQEWSEKQALGGSRYVESILAHFGVMVPDATVARPIYIGGGRCSVNVSEINATSAGDNGASTTTLGQFAGRATAYGDSFEADYYAAEHGYIIGILSVMPSASYFQGIPKKSTRLDRFDYYWPEFAHLGEQAVSNSELYYNGDAVNKDTFGYQSRYAEYRTHLNEIHGNFRNPLDMGTMVCTRVFNSQPNLNEDFIQTDSINHGLNRIFSYEGSYGDNHLMVQLYHNISALRCIPEFGTPVTL